MAEYKQQPWSSHLEGAPATGIHRCKGRAAKSCKRVHDWKRTLLVTSPGTLKRMLLSW